MAKKTEIEILDKLNQINWDFEDYNSTKYPLDINSIPWYPATFPAPIPKYLIALLSKKNDLVLDPFGGKGTTCIEALKQKRKFFYNDLNPHAVFIMRCILDAIDYQGDEKRLKELLNNDRSILHANSPDKLFREPYPGKNIDITNNLFEKDSLSKILQRGINSEVVFWFHKTTIEQLVAIFDLIQSCNDSGLGIRKLAFVSILKEVCSQRGHFSYITDNCKPKQIKYYDAVSAYLEMLERIILACIDFKRQYKIINSNDDCNNMIKESYVHFGNAKSLSQLKDKTVDLVVTSPPYLCAQDYILTMRLNNLFYPDDGFVNLPFKEIAPRRLRRKPDIVESYYKDIEIVVSEIHRVLKRNSYFCLVLGQGKGQVSENERIVQKVSDDICQKGFVKLFQKTRTINYRTNRIGGVNQEDIIVFRKK